MGWEWSYCRHCDRGLRRATMREVLDGTQYCADGHANTPNVTKNDLLVELFERVEELERKLDNHLA
jgi:hypothetical protein